MKVFLNGCWDILHLGHINLLLYARHLAGLDGKVIVALDEDDKILADKGLKRPIFDVHERGRALLELQMNNKGVVDEIEFFLTDTQLLNIIHRIKPDIIVKGSDWRDKYVVGSEVAKVMFFDRMKDYSTTEIIRRVLEKNTILK